MARIPVWARLVPLVSVLLAASAAAERPRDLLPDFVTDPARLRNHTFDWGVWPGCVELRFPNGVINLGRGPAEIVGARRPNADGTQTVYQIIYRSNGKTRHRLAGYFAFHPEHNHVHFEDYAAYRLRAVRSDGGVGAILREGEKTSFCLRDTVARALDLPGAPQRAVYVKCEYEQGISVGWEDKYPSHLPGQSLLLCGLRPKTYWLESEVDPDDHLLERIETNNTARVLVQMPPPPECNNGRDDDRDGRIDFPDDRSCLSLDWPEE